MSFMKKGLRENNKKTNKKIIEAVEDFNKILTAMNFTYHQLLKKDDLTEENIEDKIIEVCDFKFTSEHIQMLKDDLLKNNN